MQLTTEQLDAAEKVVASAKRNGLSTLGGYAGTGKTTILSHLLATLQGWKFVAYTGKAASNLRKKGVPATTIHSAIYEAHHEPPNFELKSPGQLSEVRGFAIDEASMVGTGLLNDLRSFGKPIVAVGDHGQLPPVKDDGGLMLNPEYRLETIHRNAGPIARFAEWLRLGEEVSEWRNLGSEVNVVKSVTIDTLVGADQIICAYNADRKRINGNVRRVLGLTGGLVVGDRVIVLKNNREHGVYNGQQGKVTWCSDSHLEMPERFRYTFSEGGTGVPIDYAYCVTCHKAQGDEWDKVVVLEPRPSDLWPHCRWTYTAASRAKVALTWVLGG